MTKNKNKLNKLLKAFAIGAIAISLSSVTYSSAPYLGAAVAVDNPVITYTNQERINHNMKPLLPDRALTIAANAKAYDMLDKQYFDHVSPAGKTPWMFINASGYQYSKAGENLAIGFNDYTDIMNAWMKSESHRENILKPEYQNIGIGIARGVLNGKEELVIVQMFGTKQ